MATSSLSSLGLGSDGALSYDTIDKLRAVDEKAILNPIDTKMNLTQQPLMQKLQLILLMLKTISKAQQPIIVHHTKVQAFHQAA